MILRGGNRRTLKKEFFVQSHFVHDNSTYNGVGLRHGLRSEGPDSDPWRGQWQWASADTTINIITDSMTG
jgi:hypothetical protein